jgi:hypothetical protein
VIDHRDHVRALVADLPADGSVVLPVAWVRALVAEPEKVFPITQPDASWRERLWLVPADTLLTVREAAEALGKSPSAVHKLAARHRIPYTRAAAGHSPVAGPPLMFRAADLRRFLEGRRAA